MNSTTIEQNAMRYAQAVVAQMQYERVPAMMQYEAARKPQALVVESVVIKWSESNQYDGPQTFATIAEADALLRSWAWHAPQTGAYDKTDFKVTFKSGPIYQGRFDLQYQHRIKTDLLKAQMVGFIRYGAENPHGMFSAEDVQECREALPLYEAIDRGEA